MKLISRLLIVAIVPMMLLVACTNQDSNAQGQAPAPLVPSDTEQAARQAQAAAEEMRQTINRLMQENQQLTRELHAMQGRVMAQGSTLSNLSQQASRLEGAVAAAGAGGDAAAIAQQQAAQRDADAKSPFGSLVLIIIFALVALIVIYFIYRALKPRPFEDDEDDDFSSFDDDFGFDDEEDDDESADEDKKQDDEDDK